jgi:hypothetical protein
MAIGFERRSERRRRSALGERIFWDCSTSVASFFSVFGGASMGAWQPLLL